MSQSLIGKTALNIGGPTHWTHGRPVSCERKRDRRADVQK